MNFGTLQSLIAKEYMKVLYDNIFVRSHYLLAKLKSKAKTFNGRRISVPVEGGDAGDVNWGSWHGVGSNISSSAGIKGFEQPTNADVLKAGYRDLPFSYTDPFTLAEYVPKMLTGTLAITKEETLMMNSKQAIANIVTAKVKNLQKVIEKKVAYNLYDRRTAEDSEKWDCIEQITDTGVLGGINPADGSQRYKWWKGRKFDASTLGGTEANLEANIFKLLAQGIGMSRHQIGENPDCIVVPQYIYDLIEAKLNDVKRGPVQSQVAGKLGFTALDYRGIPIVAEVTLPDHQTGDTDGRIYFLNTEYMHMFFNSGAKFTAGKMIEDPDANRFQMKVHSYGGMVVTNRNCQVKFTGLYSPVAYSIGGWEVGTGLDGGGVEEDGVQAPAYIYDAVAGNFVEDLPL